VFARYSLVLIKGLALRKRLSSKKCLRKQALNIT
jgi:hypothetical protein